MSEFINKIVEAAEKAGVRHVELLARECDARNIDDLRSYANSAFGRTSIALEGIDYLDRCANDANADDVAKAIEDLQAQCQENPGCADTTEFFRCYRNACGLDPIEEINIFLDNVEIENEDDDDEE